MKSLKKTTTQKSPREESKLTHVSEITKRLFPTAGAKREEGGHFADFTYGNVWTRIWKNTSKNGDTYFRISLNRLDVKEGEVIVRNNFTSDNLDDLMRTVRRCKIWFGEK